jgi:hypothetical protein
MVNTTKITELIPEADINGKHRNYVNEDILNNEAIRRIILSNIDSIKALERSRGCKQYTVLNEYINNRYSVWISYNYGKKDKKYISAGQILMYLAYLGYKIDFTLVKVD